MKLSHDAETDMAFIAFRTRPSVDSFELCEGIVIDLDEDEQVVAIEIEDASAKFDVEELRAVLAPEAGRPRAGGARAVATE